METAKKFLHQFYANENIVPSENWDLSFQKKLNNARFLKSCSVLKYNFLVLLLILLNVGCIWNFLSTKTNSQEIGYEIISDHLLLPNN